MPSGKGFLFPSVPNGYSLTHFESILDIDEAELRRLLPANDPFLSPPFLGALERHGAAAPHLGWTPHHLALRDDSGRITGVLPLYVKANSFGEFIYDWSWASAFEQTGLAYYPKLFSGIPYTPTTGARLWVGDGDDADAIRATLIDAAIGMAQRHQLSSWHVAFPAEADRQALEAAGLLTRHDMQYHWKNRGYRDFADFLACFSADKRRKVRAERRKVSDAGIDIAVLAGDAIVPELWPQIYRLYAATFDKYGNHPALSARCLAEIGAELGERMVVFVASRNEQAVAVSICFRDDHTLYGRYWGTAERIDGLHFELCYYQGIDYCLRHGLQRFEPGAGGEHKIARGFEPITVTTMHWIADERMRQILRTHLHRATTAVEEYGTAARGHLPFREA